MDLQPIHWLIQMLLCPKTQFKIKRVYGYATYPGYPLLLARQESANYNYKMDDEEFEQYTEEFNNFSKQLEKTLRHHGVADNKIAVELEFALGEHIGTIFWCYKDSVAGFFFTCRPVSKYVRWVDAKFSLSDE